MKHPVGFGNINPRPSADVLFTLFFKSDAPWNESDWKNEKFDQLLVAARGETDEAKRKQMYADMQVLVHEGAASAFRCSSASSTATPRSSRACGRSRSAA